MFKAILKWLKGGSSSEQQEAELAAANAAPYKVEAPKTVEQIKAEKLEKFELNNGDTDAPAELAERAMKLAEGEKPAVVEAAPAKKARKPRAPKAAKAAPAVEAKAVAKPKRTPRITAKK